MFRLPNTGTMLDRKGLLYGLAILALLLTGSSCTKSVEKEPQQSASLRELYLMTISSPRTAQDFKSAIALYESGAIKQYGEHISLAGLAYLYQAEVYETVAQLLAMLQVDLFIRGDDPEHGDKFPIDRQELGYEEHVKLAHLLLFDLWKVNGISDALTTHQDDDLSDFTVEQKSLIRERFAQVGFSWRDWVRDRDLLIATGRNKKTASALFEAATLYDNNEYRQSAELLISSKIVGMNLFFDNEYVSYFDPLGYHLLAATYHEIGIEVLDEGLEMDFVSPDSAQFQMMNAITLLGALTRTSRKHEEIVSWHNYSKSQQNNPQKSHFQKLVCNRPFRYTVDWITAVSIYGGAGDPVFKMLNDALACDFEYDPLRETMFAYITNDDQLTSRQISGMLDSLIQNPEAMDEYPVLLPYILGRLCMSDYRHSKKNQLQAVCENLLFDISRSSNTMINNRPAFLLQTLGVFRWHGGRLPDGIGFLIELEQKDQALIPVHHLLKIFINQMIEL